MHSKPLHRTRGAMCTCCNCSRRQRTLRLPYASNESIPATVCSPEAGVFRFPDSPWCVSDCQVGAGVARADQLAAVVRPDGRCRQQGARCFRRVRVPLEKVVRRDAVFRRAAANPQETDHSGDGGSADDSSSCCCSTRRRGTITDHSRVTERGASRRGGEPLQPPTGLSRRS